MLNVGPSYEAAKKLYCRMTCQTMRDYCLDVAAIVIYCAALLDVIMTRSVNRFS